MALETGSGDVFARQRECGLGGVIEFGAAPIDSGVTLRAILREACGGVIRIRGALIILQVAGIARGA